MADPARRVPFAPELNVARRVLDAGRAQGVMVYPGRGSVDGVSGDVIMVGPPAIISEAEIDLVIERVTQAIQAAVVPLAKEASV
jgi:adenosylmethionine-8-amino-7-oxononanoate aminotransferase